MPKFIIQNFDVRSVSCKQSKFQQQIHSKWKMLMQKILRNAYDIVLFTINPGPLAGTYSTCFETVNLEQTLTVQ